MWKFNEANTSEFTVGVENEGGRCGSIHEQWEVLKKHYLKLWIKSLNQQKDQLCIKLYGGGTLLWRQLSKRKESCIRQ